MGFVSFYGILGVVLYLLAAIIITGFVPNILDIEPKSYKLKLMDKFSGPYEPNTRLDKAVRLFENTLIGPESLALYKGSVYSGLHTGEIVRINSDKDVTTVAQIGKACAGHWEPEICGRPLGVRVTKNGILYGVDAYYGLYKVDLKTGSKSILLPMTKPIDGLPMKFPDDLAVDEDGVVYLSDASTKWSLDDIVYTVIEYCNRGRIIKYDPKTGQASAIMKDLHFPNGVQLTHDGKGLLVAELMKHRILKYNLEGGKKGTIEVFASVPGEPDNIRPSSSGGYWIAMVGARNGSTPILPDYVSEYPKLRQTFSRMVYGIGTLLRYIAKYIDYPAFKEFGHKFQKMWYNMWIMTYGGSCMVIELNKDGQVVQTLQSTDTRYCFVSEVLEKDGYLYLGSFINPYLTKVKL